MQFCVHPFPSTLQNPISIFKTLELRNTFDLRLVCSTFNMLYFRVNRTLQQRPCCDKHLFGHWYCTGSLVQHFAYFFVFKVSDKECKLIWLNYRTFFSTSCFLFSSQMSVTDNDLIEKSNLSRQFLFRSRHIQVTLLAFTLHLWIQIGFISESMIRPATIHFSTIRYVT